MNLPAETKKVKSSQFNRSLAKP